MYKSAKFSAFFTKCTIILLCRCTIIFLICQIIVIRNEMSVKLVDLQLFGLKLKKNTSNFHDPSRKGNIEKKQTTLRGKCVRLK